MRGSLSTVQTQTLSPTTTTSRRREGQSRGDDPVREAHDHAADQGRPIDMRKRRSGHAREVARQNQITIGRTEKGENHDNIGELSLTTHKIFLLPPFSSKKYNKKSPKRDYRDKSRERYSNGSRRRDYDRDGKDRERAYADKDYYSSKHSSSRNGSRHHHKSRR